MLWEERWKTETSRVDQLSRPDQLRLAVACIDRAVWRLRPYLAASAVREYLATVDQALDLLWKTRVSEMGPKEKDACTELRIQLVDTIPDRDAPPLAVDGWDDLIYGISNALDLASGRKSKVNPLYVPEKAYSALWFQRIYPQTTEPLFPWDMDAFCRQLELKDPVSMEDLAFQFECTRPF